MIVSELIKTMAEDFRESLWDIFIDDLEIEEVEEPKNGYGNLLNEEVYNWYIEPPYTDGKFFVMKMCIYTKKHYKEIWGDPKTVREFLRRTKDTHDGYKAIVYDENEGENECLSFTLSKESYLEFEKTIPEKILERFVHSEHYDYNNRVIHIGSREEE